LFKPEPVDDPVGADAVEEGEPPPAPALELELTGGGADAVP
jgi:hypothetical protein